ncbi:MAG: hypothetical protein L6R40_003810 [Gallowayella cf. fulva]|nr:MAG: hypothetical protein L6R40_003810 [Xanthomendoza cf. fulva]
MYFSTLTAVILAASPMISALNYRGYSSTNSCSGSAFGCSDNGNVCCGSMPAGYGYSAQFDNLPAGTQGQGYKDGGCSSYLFTVYGPGNACWKSGGNSRATNLNWFHSAGSRVKPRGSAEEKCSPHYFSYPDEAGQMREVKVEDAEHAVVLADLYQNGDFSALEKVEKYKH